MTGEPAGPDGCGQCRTAAAVAACQQLMVRCAVRYDAGKVEDLLRLFTPDVVVDSPLGLYQGQEQVRRYYLDVLANFRQSQHFLTNIDIELDPATGEPASGTAYVQAFVLRNDGRDYALGAVYHDTFRFDGQQWLIARHAIEDRFCYEVSTFDPKERLRWTGWPGQEH